MKTAHGTVAWTLLHLLCTLQLGVTASVCAQSASSISTTIPNVKRPIRLPTTGASPETDDIHFTSEPQPGASQLDAFELPRSATEVSRQGIPASKIRGLDEVSVGPGHAEASPELEFLRIDDQPIRNAFGTLESENVGAVRAIPSYVAPKASAHRIVRYEIPLDDAETNLAFTSRGIEGRLIEVSDQSQAEDDSLSDRLRTFLSPASSWRNAKKVRVVRYEVPADDIMFHAQLSDLDGELLEPGMLRLPEVRFFQPKARVFMDLKQSNDGEFDLFNDGAILASLDVIELYFPMPLISERFAEMFGKPDRLSSLGWRVGGTLGLGITTALNNGTSENGSAPVSTISTGIRYEFPLGRPSRELLDTGDMRIDQRTRVGMEFGLQGGISTREALRDSTDVGLYFGILVNTPWGA